MGIFSFSQPWLLCAAIVPLALGALRVVRRGSTPSIDYPSSDWLPGRRIQGTAASIFIPQLRVAAMLLLVPVLAGIAPPDAQAPAPARDAVMIVLDASSSMTAEDFQPSSRLEAARRVLQEFVRTNPHSEIGLITFAGTPRLIAPVTSDHNAVIGALSAVGPAAYGEDGTSIGSGIGSALNRLRAGPWRSRRIVLITDGVSNRGQVAPGDAAQMARLLGVVVDAIGMGTDSVTRFWIPGPDGEQVEVKSRVDIDDEALAGMSRATGGEYRRVRSAEELRRALSEFHPGEGGAEAVRSAGQARFPAKLLAGAALLLLLLEFALCRFIVPELPGV